MTGVVLWCMSATTTTQPAAPHDPSDASPNGSTTRAKLERVIAVAEVTKTYQGRVLDRLDGIDRHLWLMNLRLWVVLVLTATACAGQIAHLIAAW